MKNDIKNYISIIVMIVSSWLALYTGGYLFIIKSIVNFISSCINGTFVISLIFFTIIDCMLGFVVMICIALIGILTSYLILIH